MSEQKSSPLGLPVLESPSTLGLASIEIDFATKGYSLVVGRRSSCDVRVPSKNISRQHVRLTLTSQGIVIRDLNSTNGTFINRQLLPPNTDFLLKPQDEIGLGTSFFWIAGQGETFRLVVAKPKLSALENNSVKRTAPTSILIINPESEASDNISFSLRREGYQVRRVTTGQEALTHLKQERPNLIISSLIVPDLDAFGMLLQLRRDPVAQNIPIILLTSSPKYNDVIAGLGFMAEDCLVKPVNLTQLLLKVQSRLSQPAPQITLPLDRHTGLLGEELVLAEARHTIARLEYKASRGSLAYLYLNELPGLTARFGEQAELEIAQQVTELLLSESTLPVFVGRGVTGQFALLLPWLNPKQVRRRLTQFSARLVRHTFLINDQEIRLTPTIGYTLLSSATEVEQLREQALTALHHATAHLDLQPMRYQISMEPKQLATTDLGEGVGRHWRKWKVRQKDFFEKRLRVPLQIAVSFAISFGLPLIIYITLARLGLDISIMMYYLVVFALLATAYLIWVEGFMAARVVNPPEVEAAQSYPTASAIIAAYLPNEADTIVETIEAFLRVDYPGPLQIILAYNTPRPVPVERILKQMAQSDPRFMALKVENSTSKAQNVNAALAHVEGEFVGVFDADHHPDPDSFKRAWRWLSPAGGYDVVQGHCLVRNGDESWVARMVAVEFEGIYAVSHPGRSRLHRFGIFGGSNGYWKTSLLHQTRMHGFMLTEDIDSSLRVTEAGYKIASDPLLVSRELAPVNLKALWNQRMRWAQGWFQVSLKHVVHGMRSPHLSLRQKLGLFQLLAWREIYPWLSSQILPIIAFLAWKYQGFDRLNWAIPIFVLTTIFVVSTGPCQVIFAYLLAEPQIRRRRSWFWFYLVISLLFYTGYKNLIARVAQIKEFMHERQWKVTPRASTASNQNQNEEESDAQPVSA